MRILRPGAFQEQGLFMNTPVILHAPGMSEMQIGTLLLYPKHDSRIFGPEKSRETTEEV